MPTDNDTRAPASATLTEYTLTIEATCTATVFVKSTSPIKAGKWLRDVAIPNQLVDHGNLHYKWETASVTWDDGDESAEVPPCLRGLTEQELSQLPRLTAHEVNAALEAGQNERRLEEAVGPASIVAEDDDEQGPTVRRENGLTRGAARLLQDPEAVDIINRLRFLGYSPAQVGRAIVRLNEEDRS